MIRKEVNQRERCCTRVSWIFGLLLSEKHTLWEPKKLAWATGTYSLWHNDIMGVQTNKQINKQNFWSIKVRPLFFLLIEKKCHVPYPKDIFKTNFNCVLIHEVMSLLLKFSVFLSEKKKTVWANLCSAQNGMIQTFCCVSAKQSTLSRDCWMGSI